MTMQTAHPCLFMRGGTSRGPFFNAADLPADIATRDRVLLAVMGLPDKRQMVVVLATIARQAADAAEKREANEVEKRAKLAAGVLGLDMYEMRGPLQKAGLRYID